jgi:hypothetical protein
MSDFGFHTTYVSFTASITVIMIKAQYYSELLGLRWWENGMQKWKLPTAA